MKRQKEITKTESVEEYLQRGGTITKVKAGPRPKAQKVKCKGGGVIDGDTAAIYNLRNVREAEKEQEAKDPAKAKIVKKVDLTCLDPEFLKQLGLTAK